MAGIPVAEVGSATPHPLILKRKPWIFSTQRNALNCCGIFFLLFENILSQQVVLGTKSRESQNEFLELPQIFH